MSGGGGGGGPAPQDNSLQLEMMREANAQQEQARQDALKAQQKNDFIASKSQAIDAAHNTGKTYFASRGLNPDTYSGLIDSIINDASLKVPELDTNPGQYFTTDAFASGIDNAQTLGRTKATGAVNSTFAPGFDTNLIPDTAGDSIINSILGTQQGQAQQQIDFNRKRGVLNDVGYSEAQRGLQDQSSAAKSTLSNIERSVLGTDRQDLTNIRGNAGTAASNWNFGDPTFDPNTYYKQAQDRATSDLGNLEGSIRSAVGNTNLFDVPTLLQKAGTAQGPINSQVTPDSSGVPFAPKKVVQNRGLGSTGAF